MKYCGILNIDKPIGVTSREVVDRVVKLVRPAKAGHAGTLDPLATGVLVVCVGNATRLISSVQEGRKRYLGRFLLGQRSDTDDSTGNVTVGGDWTGVTKDHLISLLPEFTGRISQVPPQFSAIHVQGRRAYDMARRGEVVELDARPVDVFSLSVTVFQPPEFELEIECGSGVYVRSIGRDLGIRLGCGAVMTQLRRMSIGAFDVRDAVLPEMITSENLRQFLLPPINAISHYQKRVLTAAEITAVRCGQSIVAVREPHSIDVGDAVTWSLQELDPRTALIDGEGQLLGVGEIDLVNETLQPRIIFPVEVSRKK